MKNQESVSIKKLNEVTSLVAKSKASSILTEVDLTTALFEKAPSTFLEFMTTQSLAAIAEESAVTVEKYLKNPSSLAISFGQSEDSSYLIVAMSDRPFIVNTAILSVRECDSDIQTLLHPLITLKSGRRISLMYVRIDKLEGSALSLLVDRVQKGLSDLILATEDHPSILSQVDTAARLLKERVPSPSVTENERNEAADFLRWLSDGEFIFLGLAEWSVEEESSSAKSIRFLNENPKLALGIFRSTNQAIADFTNECRKDALDNLCGTTLVTLSKLITRSNVHRPERLNHLMVPQYAGDGSIRSLLSIVGLFSSKTLAQEASAIPLVREKIKNIIANEQALPNTFTYKNIIKIVDSMPKELLLRADANTLKSCVNMITGIQRESESGALVHKDASGKGATFIVAMPQHRFNEQVRANLQKHIESSCQTEAGAGDLHVALNVKPLVIVYYHVPLTTADYNAIDNKKLESALIELTKTWVDSLKDGLLKSDSHKNPETLWSKYNNSFSEEYQAATCTNGCLSDIQIMETLSSQTPLRVDVADSGATDGTFELSIYTWQNDSSVSQVLPALENAGLYILREQAFEVKAGGNTAHIHRLIAKSKNPTVGTVQSFKSNLCAGLEMILNEQADNDVLNSMLISTQLNIKALAVIRAFAAYLFQLSPFTSKGTIRNTLSAVPSAAALVWNMFEVKFNPALGLSVEQRLAKLDALKQNYLLALRNVPDISQDRILRNMLAVLEATVRTNAYTGRETLAFKIDPSKVDLIGTPKPYFEIFVRGPQTEGIHIRFGAVARGGLRWSDRRDDFRNEVLGLAKTQKVKNVVIVPTGSKGGFIVRKPAAEHDKLLKQVEDCYRDYIRSLLSVTDNRVKGQVVRPTDVVCYDKEDPYLVVAADKGTATFSDIANKIATDEFKFWLGDAFASGGSQGYDHKLYAITANGGWECAKRHFRDLGINFEKDPFTIVGIGDMSGDVFGNGLVYSDKIKLLAAFNHKHIFLDPNPDPAKSFEERKRLFTTPRTQWSDYKKELISAGGGIFGRFDKEITLSKEIREALSIADEVPNVVNGEQLITLIMKAQVDLLWNGGIGTYVKASSETNADVNDGTNDGVRVDAKDLRAKVIGEGGNLGFTQKARVEFERCGGKLNTDAIDNSGGVDLSDHEVNYKIFFSRLLEEGKITIEERNKILKEVSGFACADVLKNNASHALLLSLGSKRNLNRMIQIRDLLRDLTPLGYINRTVDTLPDDEGLGKLQSAGKGLTRPELSRIYAGLKMYLKEVMVNTGLAADAALAPYLLNYFPQQIRERFEKEALEHPLRPQIVSTKVINELVDLMGATFVHRTCRSLKATPVDVIKAYVVASGLINLPAIKAELKKLDTHEGAQNYLEYSEDLNGLMVNLVNGIVGCCNRSHDIKAMTDNIAPMFKEVAELAPTLMSAKTLALQKERETRYLQNGIDKTVAKNLSLKDVVSRMCEVLSVRSQSSTKLQEIAKAYTGVVTRLGIEDLMAHLDGMSMPNRWDQELLENSRSKIGESLRSLVIKASTGAAPIGSLGEGTPALARIRDILADIHQRGISLATISLLADDMPKLNK
jgi:glutamate dehydrogenase